MVTDVFQGTISAVTVTVPRVDGRSRYASTEILLSAFRCPIAPSHADAETACVFAESLTVSVPAEVFKMNPLNGYPPSAASNSLTTTRSFGLTALPPSCTKFQ